MTDTPDSEGLILFRVDGISEPRGEKLAGDRLDDPAAEAKKAEDVS